MADESLQLPTNQNLDYHIITLFQRLESMRKDSHMNRIGGRLSTSMKAKYNMQAEIRSLEFWRYFIYWTNILQKSLCHKSSRLFEWQFFVFLLKLPTFSPRKLQYLLLCQIEHILK